MTHPVLTDEALFPDLSRPTAEIEDPVALARAYKIDHIGISAYLVALAAWQRGLRVTFHYEVASKSPRFATSLAFASRGEFFSVSDGQKTHFFLRTLGDLTSRETSALCDDKQATKERLIAAGVPVPDGILIDRDALDEAALDGFLERHSGKSFHIKPLGGSLGVGAHGYLSAEEVPRCIAQHKDRRLLIEEHVSGFELRVNVSDEQFAGAYAGISPQVIGDGSSTIVQLVEQKVSKRRHKVLYPKALILIDEREDGCLAGQGLTAQSVPNLGQRVLVNNALTSDKGADLVDMETACNQLSRELAIRACAAVGVPFGGVDILVEQETGRQVVLEVNQCPMLKGNVFPFYTSSPGNRVAEAIIDYYFPASINNTRLTRASFDFMRVCNTLKSGTVAEVSLPVLGPGWVHKRIRFEAAVLEQPAQDAIRSLAEQHGVYIDILRLNGKEMLIDALGHSDRYDAFAKRLQASLKKTNS